MTHSASDSPHSGFSQRSPFSRFCGTASVVVLLGFLLSQLGSVWWIAELIGHFRFQFMCLMAPLPLLLLILRRRLLAVLLAVALSVAVYQVFSIYVPRTQPPAGKDILRVISVNVFQRNYSAKLLLEMVAETEPDVILIVEYTEDWAKQLESMKVSHPHHVEKPSLEGVGIALFSKLPFASARVISLDERVDVPAIFADVTFGNSTVTIAGVHPMSPLGYDRFCMRNEQLKRLAELVNAAENPMLAMGDFNSTTWSPYVINFCAATGLVDSRQGFGLQTTWPQWNSWLRLPIDHVFVSPNIHVHDRRIERDIGSDHYPILIDVSVPIE